MASLHQEKEKKSNTWSQKNTTHFIIDVAVSLWISVKDMEMWSGILKSLKKRSIVC